MDGNGRWAKSRGIARTLGHREGAKRVDEIVTECTRIGVKYLTLYAFSTENWKRPSREVDLLMRLLVHYLKTMDKKLQSNYVKLVAQGNLEKLPVFAQQELKRVMELTHFDTPSLCLNLCLSYGGRQEIVDAARTLAHKVLKGEYHPSQIDEKLFGKHLYNPDFPDPDLVIRTGGQYRISNFLLWEVAYSELYVTSECWPDFNCHSLHRALAAYGQRNRRFGLTGEQVLSKADNHDAH